MASGKPLRFRGLLDAKTNQFPDNIIETDSIDAYLNKRQVVTEWSH